MDRGECTVSVDGCRLFTISQKGSLRIPVTNSDWVWYFCPGYLKLQPHEPFATLLHSRQEYNQECE